MPVNHVKKYLISIHTFLVFLPFLARALYAPQYSNFGKKCPKLGPGNPEDMLFTNLSVAA